MIWGLRCAPWNPLWEGSAERGIPQGKGYGICVQRPGEIIKGPKWNMLCIPRGKHFTGQAWGIGHGAYGEVPKARNRSFLRHINKNPYSIKRLDVSL